MRKGFLWNKNFGNFCYFLMNKINIFIAFEPSTKAWKWIKMLNPKCLCKLAKTKVDLLICTNLCRVLKNKTQHKHNRARAAVQRTIFLLKFALFSKPFLKKVRASDDCKLSLDPGPSLQMPCCGNYNSKSSKNCGTGMDVGIGTSKFGGQIQK